jgi:hypothetical protein
MSQSTQTAVKVIVQDVRSRYSFGKVWTAAVVAGEVTSKNQDKLVAHAVKLKAGRKHDLSKLKFATLLTKVQAKLVA